MREDYNDIKEAYNSIITELDAIAKLLEKELIDRVGKEKHVDQISSRFKTLDSFMEKAIKRDESGELKYEVPIKEIQDKIGVRVVVYYKSDVKPIQDIITNFFSPIETRTVIPDDVSKFGYEGVHLICKIPNVIYPLKDNLLIGDFFELQIKTLYQHAWSQSNHGLGYKPGVSLTDDEARLLAFISAQSWGADRALVELASSGASVPPQAGQNMNIKMG